MLTELLFFFSLCRGKIVLGYTEAELRVRGSGYQFIHAADMLYCAENHVRSESCLCRLESGSSAALFFCVPAKIKVMSHLI